MASQIKEIQQVVSRYHQAFADKDLKTALSCLGLTYVGGLTTTTPEAIRKAIAEGLRSTKTAYANTIEFLHTGAGKNAAVVVTRETGSIIWLKGQKSSWRGITNLWYLAKVRGRWKITHSLHNLSKW
jgi:ketosteroid isomerase-like protein